MGEHGVAQKVVVYQLPVRTFSNTVETRRPDGTLSDNGVGKFDDLTSGALASLRALGVTHLWLTGVLRQATLTDHGPGLPPDDPDVVKGRAGSYYAIRDAFDVCPDYANDVGRRLDEFDALVDRVHAAGMKVILDLVPNHVARGYASVIYPELDFGRNDDTATFFSPKNDFFYLAEPPGQALSLRRPPGWAPPGVSFDGRYAREDGRDGRTPKATGNDVTSPSPAATDWYETVKLNWGRNFVDGTTSFDPRPPVWDKFDAILAYWQARGVDGFRADFAHWVPNQAWAWLLARVKERDPEAFVFAEAYEDHAGLLAAGFDAVYHDAAYDLCKRLYLGRAGAADVDGFLGRLGDGDRDRYLHYLENHDERRVASPLDPAGRAAESGFGSPAAGRQLLPWLFLATSGPVLVHAGQELGEEGAGAAGFSGENGRTSIFDYTSMPAVAAWVNGHAYDGGGLTAGQAALRAWYADLLQLCQDPSVRGDRVWRLRYANQQGRHPDANEALLAFARFETASARLLLVVANLGPGGPQRGRVRLPAELQNAAALGPDLTVHLRLDADGAHDTLLATTHRDELASAGLAVEVADQSASVYAIG